MTKFDSHKDEEKKRVRWIGCPIEDDYLGEDRKQTKMERKRASKKDRSKYKKTDQEKIKKRSKEEFIDKDNFHKGRVLSITPQGIFVQFQDTLFTCSLRGSLKKEKNQIKNLIAVGDFVLFEEVSPKEGKIFHVEDRFSTLSRADNLSRRKEQLIAANIDQVLITASVVSPPLKPFLIDRYIIAALKGNMEPIVVVNKIDLLKDCNDEGENELFQALLDAYKLADITVIPISTVTGEGLTSLKEIMKDKASVFSGQSGVGKSSLINAVADLELRVGEIVERTQKGSHTTTTANLIPLSFGGWCIDTPGIKSFGVWNLKKEDVALYYREIYEWGKKCKFQSCSHIHEEDCAVKQAVEEDKISFLRYESYLSLMESIMAEYLRR